MDIPKKLSAFCRNFGKLMSNTSQTETISAEEIVAQTETGARTIQGGIGKLIVTIAFIWSLFQLYVSSNIPYILAEFTGINVVFNNAEARQIHLAFGLTLATLAYPLFKKSPRSRIPWYDWILIGLGIVSCFYLLILRNEIATRAGLPTTADLVISTIGLIALAISVFRSLGLPLVIVASVFVFYVFFGDQSFIPDAIQWKGASYGKAMWHYWMQLEGVFGVALGVSASMIFLFVLFGSLLEKAGAGNYFIKMAFAMLGHLRGGPAKAAVVASAMSGLYSGSSIANVVTTGTFTIPLMKRTGFSPEKSGAVEVASSTNGQLTPPVMGAAAFLISEFTGVGYHEVIKHALIPAVISYIALIYIVHLEAMKMNLKGLPKVPTNLTLLQRILRFATGFVLAIILLNVISGVLTIVKVAFPALTFTTVSIMIAGSYLFLIWIASRHPDLKVDDPNAPIIELPNAGSVAVTGLHFLLPIVILIWCILIERFSPGLSAFYTTITMIVIVLTQHILKSLFRGEYNLKEKTLLGIHEFYEGMIGGARNMIGISVATGAAGIIVGTISLTGAHQVVGEFVEFLSGGNLMLMLILVAIMSLILGMGLPTTANYIVVSSLMAPVIVSLGAQTGLLVPLIAVHLFVFYFGILADDTPPVGLAAFAAAAISKGDPIRTGIQGFAYDIRTALLPFLFIFNTDLLLIDVGFWQAIFVFCIALIAMLLFAAATQGYFLVKSRIWESILILLVALTLFRPGFWLDRLQEPYVDVPGYEIENQVQDIPKNGQLRMIITGPDFDDPETIKSKTLSVTLPEADSVVGRLEAAGLTVFVEGDVAKLEEPFAGTALFQALSDFDYYMDDSVQIHTLQLPAERLPKEVFYIPALLLLAGIILIQRRRMQKI